MFDKLQKYYHTCLFHCVKTTISNIESAMRFVRSRRSVFVISSDEQYHIGNNSWPKPFWKLLHDLKSVVSFMMLWVGARTFARTLMTKFRPCMYKGLDTAGSKISVSLVDMCISYNTAKTGIISLGISSRLQMLYRLMTTISCILRTVFSYHSTWLALFDIMWIYIYIYIIDTFATQHRFSKMLNVIHSFFR